VAPLAQWNEVKAIIAIGRRDLHVVTRQDFRGWNLCARRKRICEETSGTHRRRSGTLGWTWPSQRTDSNPLLFPEVRQKSICMLSGIALARMFRSARRRNRSFCVSHWSLPQHRPATP